MATRNLRTLTMARAHGDRRTRMKRPDRIRTRRVHGCSARRTQCISPARKSCARRQRATTPHVKANEHMAGSLRGGTRARWSRGGDVQSWSELPCATTVNMLTETLLDGACSTGDGAGARARRSEKAGVGRSRSTRPASTCLHIVGKPGSGRGDADRPLTPLFGTLSSNSVSQENFAPTL